MKNADKFGSYDRIVFGLFVSRRSPRVYNYLLPSRILLKLNTCIILY